MKYVKKGRQVIALELEGLRQMQSRLDAHFDRAVELLLETLRQDRKIIVSGVGKSGAIGQKLAATFTSTGAPSVVLDPVNALHGDLGIVSEGDIFLALSYSGETEELVRILPSLRRMEVKIVALTGHARSSLAKGADVHIDVNVKREACPLNLAPTTSTTAMLAVGDALAMVVLEARGFKKEDFARFHPGGSLGKHLLLKVQDVMRPLKEVVVLPDTAKVNDALAQWNLKRAGAVVVVNAKKKLAGIYTHGDFVRGYQKNPRVGETALREVMTRNPISVRVDKMAVEVLNVFSRYRIDDLVVVDAQNRPVGLVDAQDIAKSKLV
jgi:arabinose-5-phosphate isomerase